MSGGASMWKPREAKQSGKSVSQTEEDEKIKRRRATITSQLTAIVSDGLSSIYKFFVFFPQRTKQRPRTNFRVGPELPKWDLAVAVALNLKRSICWSWPWLWSLVLGLRRWYWWWGINKLASNDPNWLDLTWTLLESWKCIGISGIVSEMTRWSGLSQAECGRIIEAALWRRNLESNLWENRVGHQLELWPWPSSNWTHCLLFQPEPWSDNPRSQLTTLASLPQQCAQLENQSRRPLRKRFANVCNYPVDFYTYTQGPYMGGGTSANSNGNGHDSPSDRCFEQRLGGKWLKWRKQVWAPWLWGLDPAKATDMSKGVDKVRATVHC